MNLQRRSASVKTRTVHFTAVSLCTFAFLYGCATVGPDYVPPPADVPADWQQARAASGLTFDEPATLRSWWTTLNDQTLDNLIEMAINNNLDVRIAEARVLEARALLGAEESSQAPTAQLDASQQRSGSSESVSGFRQISTFRNARLDASWELDLFGGTRRRVEAARADLQEQQESLRDTLVTMLAEVAFTYLRLRSQEERLAIAEANIASINETNRLVRQRLEAGISNKLELAQSTTNLEITEAQLLSIQTDLDRARNQLTTLVGEQPGALDELLAQRADGLPSVPVQVAVGIPADVLRRRPDIRRAERRIAAETARVGAATAELYPRLTLNGSVGLEALEGGNLLSAASQSFSFSPRISWPIFSAGQVRNRINAQNQRQQQALLTYERAVLAAFEDVESSISAYVNELIRNNRLQSAAEQAARTARIARDRYDAGLASFLDVLDAERTRLNVQDSLAVSSADAAINLVSLYKALGGGWENL